MTTSSCLPVSKVLQVWKRGQHHEPKICRLAVIGDMGSGKTTLIFQFSRGRVPSLEEARLSPLATDKMDVLRNGKTIELSIYDTSGDDDYAKVRALTYSQVDGVIICIPINSPKSLHRLQTDWAPEVRHLCKGRPFLLVGTKTDLRDDQSDSIDKCFVTKRQGKKVAKLIGAVKYLECSALDESDDGKSVRRVFGRAMRESLKRR